MQGKLARMRGCVYAAALDLRAFTSCKIDSRWHTLLAPGDDSRALDLSRALFRASRGIGGGWTEMLHVDTPLRAVAEQWAASSGVGPRLCPLCMGSAGTPRHTVMQCPDLKPLSEHVLDLVEAELCKAATRSDLVIAAQSWWVEQEEAGRGSHRAPVAAGSEVRWPVLVAWRWLVPMPDREVVFNADVDGHSASGVRLEGANDMGYRGVMPRRLGVILQESTLVDGSSDAELEREDVATLREDRQYQAEVARRDAIWRGRVPPLQVMTFLCSG